MKNILKNKSFKILFISTICLSIVGYSYFNKEKNAFYDIVSVASYPFQKAVSYICEKTLNFSYQFEEKEKLQSEIDSLKGELSDLRDKMVDYNEIKRENAQYAKYYEFKKENNSFKFVPACVIGKSFGNQSLSFTIDKGRNSGICVNDIVITQNGVVGCISTVGAVCSKVNTILSPQINIGVSDTESGESGVIRGKLDMVKDNLTCMMYVSGQSNLKTGSIIATNGLSGLYPKNLKLGSIKSIDYDSSELAYYAVIEPFENIKDIKEVFVITDFYAKGAVCGNLD